MSTSFDVTPRTKVLRLAKRADYDRDTVLLHGHGTKRTLLHAGGGHPVCVLR